MTLHGDEHGHRPRFVWQSFEDTIRLATLDTLAPSRRPSLGAVPPAAIFQLFSSAPFLVSPHPLSSGIAASRPPVRMASYVIPFPNGPPARS
jgi:hypothetical protein